MFEHMDVRVRAGPLSLRSAGHRCSFIASASVRRKWFWLLLPTNRLERFEPRTRPRGAGVSPKDGAKVNKSDTRVSAEALHLSQLVVPNLCPNRTACSARNDPSSATASFGNNTITVDP